MSLCGQGPTDAIGHAIRVLRQPVEATWTFSSGCGPTDANGTTTRVPLQPREATWTSSSGQGPTDALGHAIHVPWQPGEATRTSLSGQGPTDASGMSTHVCLCSQGRPPGRPQVAAGQRMRFVAIPLRPERRHMMRRGGIVPRKTQLLGT